jgi:hypothetical protein
MPTLKAQISTLAASFAADVLSAIRSASLEEILSGGGASGGGGGGGAGRGGRPAGRGRPAQKAAGPASAGAAAAHVPAKKGKGGRLARRSPADIEKVIGLITGALGKHKEGLRSEQLQKTLGISKKEITGPLTQALAAKEITKKGQKRSTTYFAK